jgi:hypothetical protein
MGHAVHDIPHFTCLFITSFINSYKYNTVIDSWLQAMEQITDVSESTDLNAW